jgi:hypothetical protein
MMAPDARRQSCHPSIEARRRKVWIKSYDSPHVCIAILESCAG